MTIPMITDKAGWETLTLATATADKGVLCSAYRQAAKRVHDVKGLGKQARDAVKAADNRLTIALDNATDGQEGTAEELLNAITTAYAAKREASKATDDLEYHFLEVFMESAKVALKVKHGTKVSVSSKDGSVTFTNGTTA